MQERRHPSPAERTSGPSVRRRRDVSWRSVDGYLAVSTVSGQALEATGPAADIWRLLDEWTTLDELSEELAHRHDADVREVRTDVAAFVDRLIDEGYAERADHTERANNPDNPDNPDNTEHADG